VVASKFDHQFAAHMPTGKEKPPVAGRDARLLAVPDYALGFLSEFASAIVWLLSAMASISALRIAFVCS
jgi:hypothetical protein